MLSGEFHDMGLDGKTGAALGNVNFRRRFLSRSCARHQRTQRHTQNQRPGKLHSIHLKIGKHNHTPQPKAAAAPEHHSVLVS